MKKKGNFRKVVSGLLAGMTMLSTVLSPMTAYAAEIQPEEKPPLYEEVKDLLDEDEVVTAKDYEIETGDVSRSDEGRRRAVAGVGLREWASSLGYRLHYPETGSSVFCSA